MQAVIIGEGYERPALEALRDELGADGVGEHAGAGRRRRARVVVPAGLGGGEQFAARRLGHDLTEAAACGTPAVATAIAGHADAVLDGESGLLVDDLGQLPGALGRVVGDEVLRSRLSKGALTRARWFTWDATARRALEALAEEAVGTVLSTSIPAGGRRSRRRAACALMARRPSGLADAEPQAGDHGVRQQQDDARAR